jgi:hypothetical protein
MDEWPTTEGPDARACTSSERTWAHRFAQLTESLRAHRHLWGPRPFACLRLPWEEAYPEVSGWLRSLPFAEVDRIESGEELPASAPALLHSWRATTARLARLAPWGSRPLPANLSTLGTQVSARKREQIGAFCGAVLPALPSGVTTLIEWCAGRGHLGHLCAGCTGLPVLSLEREAGLCAKGNHLAVQTGIRQQHLQVDVLAPATWEYLRPGVAVLALHACGVLTSTLVREAARRGVSAVAFAPCCHHFLNKAAQYTPVSAAGQRAELPLSAQDLRLSIVDEIVASATVRAAGRREEAFRLGLDLLVREASGRGDYRSPGHLPPAWVRLPFADFCRTAAAHAGLPLPAHWSPASAEAAGYERGRITRALCTVRAQFRRPLELWAVLERALCLEESGYAVRLGTFCSRQTTPRNILVVATR